MKKDRLTTWTAKYLLVGKHEQRCVLELLLLQHLHEFLLGNAQTLHVGAVDHENNAVGARIVAPPVWSVSRGCVDIVKD